MNRELSSKKELLIQVQIVMLLLSREIDMLNYYCNYKTDLRSSNRMFSINKLFHFQLLKLLKLELLLLLKILIKVLLVKLIMVPIKLEISIWYKEMPKEELKEMLKEVPKEMLREAIELLQLKLLLIKILILDKDLTCWISTMLNRVEMDNNKLKVDKLNSLKDLNKDSELNSTLKAEVLLEMDNREEEFNSTVFLSTPTE